LKKRLTFQCWNCPKTYSLYLEIDGKPRLAVGCPYCGADATADLDRYRTTRTTVMRGDGADGEIGDTLELPPVIPTERPD